VIGLAWAFKLLLSKYIATRIWHARAFATAF